MLRHCLRVMESEGLKVVLHVHDDICVECPIPQADAVERRMLEIMCHNEDWSEGLPIAAEPTQNDWYTKTKG